MVNRNYQCVICHKLFRKESGMQSHLVRSHETPAAMEVMRQDYEAKGKTTEEKLADVTRQLADANANNFVHFIELANSKTDKLSLLADYYKSEAEIKRVKHDYDNLLLIAAVAINSNTRGNVPNITGTSGGAAVSVGTLKANESDPLAPPVVSSAPTAVPPATSSAPTAVPPSASSAPTTVPSFVRQKSAMITPPTRDEVLKRARLAPSQFQPISTPLVPVPPYDPEYLERVRATFGYGKYCPTKLQNQSEGSVTGSSQSSSGVVL